MMIDFEKEKGKALEHLLDTVNDFSEAVIDRNGKVIGIPTLDSIKALVTANSIYLHYEYAWGQVPDFPLSPDEATFEKMKALFEKDQA